MHMCFQRFGVLRGAVLSMTLMLSLLLIAVAVRSQTISIDIDSGQAIAPGVRGTNSHGIIVQSREEFSKRTNIRGIPYNNDGIDWRKVDQHNVSFTLFDGLCLLRDNQATGTIILTMRYEDLFGPLPPDSDGPMSLARLAANQVRYVNHLQYKYRSSKQNGSVLYQWNESAQSWERAVDGPDTSIESPYYSSDAAIINSITWAQVNDRIDYRKLFVDLHDAPTPRIEHWEVGNEPEHGGFGYISPETFAQRYAAVYESTKAVDPEIKLGPCLVIATRDSRRWLKAIRDIGAPMDLVAYHPYDVTMMYLWFNAYGNDTLDASNFLDPQQMRTPTEYHPYGRVPLLENSIDYGFKGGLAWLKDMLNAERDSAAEFADILLATEWNPVSWQPEHVFTYAADSMCAVLGLAESILTFAEQSVVGSHGYLDPVTGVTSAPNPDARVFAANYWLAAEWHVNTIVPMYYRFQETLNEGDKLLLLDAGDGVQRTCIQDDVREEGDNLFRLYALRQAADNAIIVWGLNFADEGNKTVTVDLSGLGQFTSRLGQYRVTTEVFKNADGDSSLLDIGTPSLRGWHADYDRHLRWVTVSEEMLTADQLASLTVTCEDATITFVRAEPVINHPPVALPDAYTTKEDTTLTVKAPGVLANDTDVDVVDTPVAQLVAAPQHGTLTLQPTGSFTYTPAANYHGPDAFTYQAVDVEYASAPMTVSITVTAVNDAPTAPAQAVTVTEDTPAAITLQAADTDGDALTYTLTALPRHGTLTGAAPQLTYTPAANYFGADSFSYRVSDGALTATATVTLTVTPVNDPPQAPDAYFATLVNTPRALTLPATDIDTPALGYTLLAVPQHGTLTGVAPHFTYTPRPDFVGEDRFTYRVSDGATDSRIATVSIVVAATPLTRVLLTVRPYGATLPAGTPVVLYARARGGSAVRYQFEVSANRGSYWQPLTDGVTCAEAQHLWRPTTPGVYYLRVQATINGDPTTRVTSAFQKLTITAQPLQVGLTATPATTRVGQGPVTLQATVQGATGPVVCQFKVGYRDRTRRMRWETLQGYDGSTSCSWTPPDRGVYTLVVWVRATDSAKLYDAQRTLTYFVR